MTTISARRFLLAFAGTLVGLVALLTAHSVLVDPFGMWGTRLFPEKGYATTGRVRVAGDRIVKALILREDRFDALLVGSSRALIGFDPAHPALAARRVANAAFNGATTFENAGVIAYALERQSGLKDIYVGLDLFAFERYRSDGDYDQSAFAGASPWLGLAMRTLSRDALDGAWRYWTNVRKKTPQLTRDGFNHTPRKWLTDRRATFLAKIRGGVANCGEASARDDLFARNFAILGAAAAKAKARGVNLHFYVSPQHVWAHWHEEVAGRTPVHEQFKTQARAFAARLAALPGAGQVTLWDFDGLDAVTLEDVPPANAGRDSVYFWEHSHFRTATGDAMVAAMLGGPRGVAGFGARLDRIDPATHFAETRSKLAAWAAARPADAELVRAAAARKGVCAGEAADGGN